MNVELLLDSLVLFAYGMIGLFIVMLVLYGMVAGLTAFFCRKKKKKALCPEPFSRPCPCREHKTFAKRSPTMAHFRRFLGRLGGSERTISTLSEMAKVYL